MCPQYTATRRGRWLFRMHIWRIVFMFFIAYSTSATKWVGDGFDCTLISKKVCALTHSSTLHARKTDHYYLIKASTKSGQVRVQISYSITKHFVKISITWSIKMNVSSLCTYHCIVLHPHKDGHVWKRTQHGYKGQV